MFSIPKAVRNAVAGVALSCSGLSIAPSAMLELDSSGLPVRSQPRQKLQPGFMPEWDEKVWDSIRSGEFRNSAPFGVSLRHLAALDSLYTMTIASQKDGPPTHGPAWEYCVATLRTVVRLSRNSALMIDQKDLWGEVEDSRQIDGFVETCKALESSSFGLNFVCMRHPGVLPVMTETTRKLLEVEALKSREIPLEGLSTVALIVDQMRADPRYNAMMQGGGIHDFCSFLVETAQAGASVDGIFGLLLLQLARVCEPFVSKPLPGDQRIEQGDSLGTLLRDLVGDAGRLDSRLPAVMADLLLMGEPRSRQELEDSAAQLQAYAEAVGGARSAHALSQLRRSGVMPTAGLLSGLREGFERLGIASNLRPLLSNHGSVPLGLLNGSVRELAVRNAQVVELRLGRLLDSLNDTQRKDNALIVLTGSDSDGQLAGIIDLLLSEGRGVVLCDLSGKSSLDDILAPLEPGVGAERRISAMIVLGKADWSFEAQQSSHGFAGMQRGPRPTRLSLASGDPAIVPPSIDAFRSPRLHRLLERETVVTSWILNDVIERPANAQAGEELSKKMLEKQRPLPVSLGIGAVLDCDVDVVSENGRGAPVVRRTPQMRFRQVGSRLPAFEVAHGREEVEILNLPIAGFIAQPQQPQEQQARRSRFGLAPRAAPPLRAIRWWPNP
jgi:hypothetical protein